MTQEQLTIVQEFQDVIEIEYALCVSEIRKINDALVRNGVHEPGKWSGTNCANQSFFFLYKYWQNRLDCLINILLEKDYKLNEELAKKYLKGIKFRISS